MTAKEYKTTDMVLASALIASGYKIERLGKMIGGVDKSRLMSSFIFDDTKELREFVDKYYRRELQLVPQHLFEAYRDVKFRMYQNMNTA